METPTTNNLMQQIKRLKAAVQIRDELLTDRDIELAEAREKIALMLQKFRHLIEERSKAPSVEDISVASLKRILRGIVVCENCKVKHLGGALKESPRSVTNIGNDVVVLTPRMPSHQRTSSETREVDEVFKILAAKSVKKFFDR